MNIQIFIRIYSEKIQTWFKYIQTYLLPGLLAACGELFELSFDLPFFEFLPETVLFKFWIQIEGGDLNFFIPEVSSSFIAVHSLYKNGKVRNRDGSITWDLSSLSKDESKNENKGRSKVKKWRNICKPR